MRFPGASRDVNDLVSTPFVRNTSLAGVGQLEAHRLNVCIDEIGPAWPAAES